MTTYNTGNSLGSSAAKDLYDNTQNFDHLSNDQSNELWPDRFGNPRLTWHGMEIRYQEKLASMGWTLIDSFQDGANLTRADEALHWQLPDGNGEYYRWDGILPKDVPAGSTPDSTGGTGQGAWVAIGDASLRSDLSANGDRITGSSYGGSVYTDYLESFNKRLISFSEGGELNGPQDVALYSDGYFYKYIGINAYPLNVAAGTAPDSNWQCVGNAQRGYGVPVSVEQFITPEMDAAGDHTAAINAALNSGAPLVNFPARTIYWDGTPLIVKTGTTINAYGCTLKLKPGNYPSISTGVTNRKAYDYDVATAEHYDIVINVLVIDGNKANVTWDTTVDTSTFNGFWFH